MTWRCWSLPLMVPSEDMLHVRWLSLDNSLWGLPHRLARESIALALVPTGVGRAPGGQQHQSGRVLHDRPEAVQGSGRAPGTKDWKAKKAGSRNAGDIAVLEQGLKWQQLGMTAQDAEFILSRNFSVEETARIFRMPPHKLGVQTQGHRLHHGAG
jgi:HK97 family phage portal protein